MALHACKYAASTLTPPARHFARALSLLPSLSSSTAAAAYGSPIASCSTSASPSSSAAATAANGVSAAPAGGEAAIELNSGYLSRAVKEHPRVAIRAESYWTRKGPDGKPKPPLTTREKVYWGLGIGGFSLALAPRVIDYLKKKEDPEVVERREREKRELERKRRTMIYVMATGNNFLGKDADMYEGLSPKEINQLAQERVGSMYVQDDPFEGLSPEEIDKMMAAIADEQKTE